MDSVGGVGGEREEGGRDKERGRKQQGGVCVCVLVVGGSSSRHESSILHMRFLQPLNMSKRVVEGVVPERKG